MINTKKYIVLRRSHLIVATTGEEITWTQICASLNHCKKTKAEPSHLIPRNITENRELLF